MKTVISAQDDKVTTVSLQHFQKTEVKNKYGDVIKRLQQVTTQASIEFLLAFGENMIPNVIHHRNHLKHYQFQSHFKGVFIDIDFSQNLDVPVKFEPQSLHWTHEQVTVHSGILKTSDSDIKEYHPYISDDKKHDQQFVEVVIDKMLEDVNVQPSSHIIIESDNCSSQYKSTNHFESIQHVANKFNVNVIQVFGIAEHGKGEVDHVGGLTKTTIRRAIASGKILKTASGMVEFLQTYLESTDKLTHKVLEISKSELDVARLAASKKGFITIDGSSLFQVMIFTPHSTHIKASPRICLCELCKLKLGSCKLFQQYDLRFQSKKISTLRSDHLEKGQLLENSEGSDVITEYLVEGTICAVAASNAYTNLIWFIKINTQRQAKEDIHDDYGNIVKGGNSYYSGNFLESRGPCRGGEKYELMEKNTFFFKESVVYPFVCFKEDNGYHIISREDYCDILNYVDASGMASL